MSEEVIQTAIDANAEMIAEWTSLAAARGTARPPTEREVELSKRIHEYCRILAYLADRQDKVAEVSKADMRTMFPPSVLDERFRAVIYTDEYLRAAEGGGGATAEAPVDAPGEAASAAMEVEAAVPPPGPAADVPAAAPPAAEGGAGATGSAAAGDRMADDSDGSAASSEGRGGGGAAGGSSMDDALPRGPGI